MKKPIRAKKSLGQNFLHHRGTLNKIVNAADVQSTDHVIEVGPGKGALTRELLQRAEHVTAIELDDRLIPELQNTFQTELESGKLTLLHQDALTFTPPPTPYKLVANIPYYITSPLINHFLREQSSNRRPRQMTLLIQKEVAQKIISGKSLTSKKLNVLALQVQLFGTPKIVAKVPPSHFKPAPKVDSAILNVKMNAEGCPIADDDLMNFFTLIHTGFAHRRKKLIRNLEGRFENLLALFQALNWNENLRAEDLTIAMWKSLYEGMEQNRHP